MKKILALYAAAAFLFSMTACTASDIPQSIAENTASTAAPAEDIIIRLAVNKYMGYEVDEAVKAFNALDNGYEVKTYVYDSEQMYHVGGAMKTADLKLQMDIMNGDTVDMVADAAFGDISRYDILTEKGAFADLYPFLDSDVGISRSELNAHILEIHETDGMLCQMPMYFNIETMIGWEEHVGTKEQWTFAEMLEKWEAMPEGAAFCNNSTQLGVYRAIIRSNLSAFVDYENGTCSFDSPEFVRLLEFCAGFPRDPDSYVEYLPGAQAQFLQYCPIMGFHDYHYTFSGNFYGYPTEDVQYTIVGYPSEDGTGSYIDTVRERYSICASAAPEVQAGAWAFMSYMLEEDFQYERDGLYKELTGALHPNCGFPVNTAAFERKAAELWEEHLILSTSGDLVDIGPLTQEEYDRLVRLVNSLTRMHSYVDRSAWTIIEEEIEMLFNGTCTAEEAAERIQGRMEIMISEKM